MVARLFGLDGDRGGDGYGFGGVFGNLYRDGGGQVAGEDHVARPFEVPAVVDGEDGVGAGGEALEIEAAVEVALVAEEGVDLGEFAAGEGEEEGSGSGFAVALGDAFDGVGADVEVNSEGGVGPGSEMDGVAGQGLVAVEDLADEAVTQAGAEREVVIAGRDVHIRLGL